MIDFICSFSHLILAGPANPCVVKSRRSTNLRIAFHRHSLTGIPCRHCSLKPAMSFNHITFRPVLKQRKKKKPWPSGETSRIYICQGKRHRPDTNKFLFQSIDKSGTPRSALVTQTRDNNWQIRRIPIRLAASRSEQDPDPNTHALPILTDSETWLIQATFSLIYLSYIKALPYAEKPDQGSADF